MVDMLLVLSATIIFVYAVSLGRYKERKVIEHDVCGYYAYLPATFIYHDLSFAFVDEQAGEVKYSIWVVPSPSGKKMVKFPVGTSVLYTPFFLMAHLFAQLSGVEANGYTWPYHFFLLLAAVFYMLAGLLYLRRVLSRYFSIPVVLMSLLALAFASNIFYFSTSTPAYSHVFSFFLFSAFLYHITSFYREGNSQKTSTKHVLIAGVVFGLIVLVRQSNILLGIFLLLYRGGMGLKEWFNFLWSGRRGIIGAALLSLAVIFLQFAYLKYSTGEWFYYAYGNERFYLLNPHVLEGLLSYRKGWLVYTPVMSLAVVGFIFLRRRLPEFFWPILIFSIVNIYVIFSWWCWWYGGGFGARSMIDSYPLLVIPLAVMLEKLWSKGLVTRILSFTLIVFFIHLNLFQSRQYRIGILHYESTSKELYWSVFLKNGWPDNYEEMLDHPDSEKAIKGEL